MKTSKKIIAILSFLLAVFLITGCNNTKTEISETAVASVSTIETTQNNLSESTTEFTDDVADITDSIEISASEADREQMLIAHNSVSGTAETNSIHKILQEKISNLKCINSLERFSDNTNISQKEMSVEEIIRLLVDRNIACYYSFGSDVLMFDYQNYNDNGYGKIEHYLFSSYSELEEFVYSTYEKEYAENLLTNLYGEPGILFGGDDKNLLYNPSIQGINVLIGDIFPLYECKITEMTDSRICFNVISCENDTVLWETSAILQNDEWRLEAMFPDIQKS